MAKKKGKKKDLKKKTLKKKDIKKKKSKKKELKKKDLKKKNNKKKELKKKVIKTETSFKDHSSNYNVRNALQKLRTLKKLEDVETFTKGEKRLTINRAVPALKKRIK